jgi:hypothetical protein
MLGLFQRQRNAFRIEEHISDRQWEAFVRLQEIAKTGSIRIETKTTLCLFPTILPFPLEIFLSVLMALTFYFYFYFYLILFFYYYYTFILI